MKYQMTRRIFVWRCILSLGLTLFSLETILGCATGEKVRMSVRENMTKQEVIDILGHPDGQKRYEDSQGQYLLMTYTDKIISGWNTRNTADYYFIFKNNKLTEWGTGEVRASQSSTGMIMFIPITY